MPTRKEIEKFCRKVENKEIYLEYETQYYEFDDDGRYMDDWKRWHHDPFGVKEEIQLLKGKARTGPAMVWNNYNILPPISPKDQTTH